MESIEAGQFIILEAPEVTSKIENFVTLPTASSSATSNVHRNSRLPAYDDGYSDFDDDNFVDDGNDADDDGGGEGENFDEDNKAESNNGRWTKAEHEMFLRGMSSWGRDWKKVQSAVKVNIFDTILQYLTVSRKITFRGYSVLHLLNRREPRLNSVHMHKNISKN
jgi:hypothetical protein